MTKNSLISKSSTSLFPKIPTLLIPPVLDPLQSKFYNNNVPTSGSAYMQMPIDGILFQDKGFKNGPCSDLKILGLASDPTACGFFRIVYPLMTLADKGADVTVRLFIPDFQIPLEVILNADVILVQRAHTLWQIELLERFRRLYKKTIIYDLDDYLHGINPQSPAYKVYNSVTSEGRETLSYVDKFLKLADGVIFSTRELANIYKAQRKDTHLLLNGVDFNLGHRDWDLNGPKYPWKEVASSQGCYPDSSSQLFGWSGGSCFDDQTEVLTDKGFKLFSALEGKEKFATLNKEGFLEFNPSSYYLNEEYSGEMYSIETKDINLKVTPNHWLYCAWANPKNDRLQDFTLVQAHEVFQKNHLRFKRDAFWVGTNPRHIILNKKKLVTNPWLYILGLFMTQGSFVKGVPVIGGDDATEKILKQSRLTYHRWDNLFTLLDTEIYKYLKNAKKMFIRPILKLSSINLRSFLKGAFSLGNVRTNSRVYMGILQEMALKSNLGITCRKGSKSYILTLDSGARLRPGIKIEDQKTEHYEGRIYCVTVPNNNLYVKRGDSAFWCGNTHKADLEELRGFIKPILEKTSNTFFGICTSPDLAYQFCQGQDLPNHRIFFLPPTQFRDYPRTLSGFDLTVIPLENSLFNQSKSGLRILENGAWGTPYVASKVAPFQRYHKETEGKGGEIVDFKSQFVDKTVHLLNHSDVLKEKSAFILENVRTHHDIKKTYEDLPLVINQVRNADQVRPTSLLIKRDTSQGLPDFREFSPKNKKSPCVCGSGKQYNLCCAPAYGRPR